LNRTWIKDFIEKISRVEGHFELYATVFLKYENQYLFGVQDSKEWTYDDNKKKASLSAFGGKIEEETDIIQFLKKNCMQELGVNIEIADSMHTYIDYHHRLKKMPVIEPVRGEVRPHMISVVQKPGHSVTPKSLIFSYLGNTKQKPNSIKYSALLLARERVLVQMFKNEKTSQELKRAGAVFEERIKIPDNLFLYPAGSINSLLRYLSYEVF
jgi:hypothetical protein